MKKFLLKILDKFMYFNWPLSHKQFNLEHYPKILSEINRRNVKIGVGLVTTDGAFTNLLIRILNKMSKDKRKRKSKITHAFFFLVENNDIKVVESIERKGVIKRDFLPSIGQRDLVILRTLNKKMINDKFEEKVIEYIKKVVDLDNLSDIPYDTEHNIFDQSKYDCSELIYHSLKYALKECDQHFPIEPIKRLKHPTWMPVDIQFSDLFVDFYDSNKGI